MEPCAVCLVNCPNRMLSGCTHRFCHVCLGTIMSKLSRKCPLCRARIASVVQPPNVSSVYAANEYFLANTTLEDETLAAMPETSGLSVSLDEEEDIAKTFDDEYNLSDANGRSKFRMFTKGAHYVKFSVTREDRVVPRRSRGDEPYMVLKVPGAVMMYASDLERAAQCTYSQHHGKLTEVSSMVSDDVLRCYPQKGVCLDSKKTTTLILACYGIGFRASPVAKSRKEQMKQRVDVTLRWHIIDARPAQ